MSKSSLPIGTNLEKGTFAAKISLKKFSYGFVGLNGLNFLLVIAGGSFLAKALGYITFNQALLAVLGYLAFFYFFMHRAAKKMLNSYITKEGAI